MKSEFDKSKIYLVAAIRRIWRWSKARRECLKNAKECYVCHKKAKEYQADHVEPVGAAPRTWNGWDGYLARMFDGKLSPICKPCHKEKSKKEAAERKRIKIQKWCGHDDSSWCTDKCPRRSKPNAA